MKKNIIIAAIAAASALFLSVSCQKENQLESQNRINAGANTFTATIEQSLTKTTLTDAYKVNWTTGDKININGVTFKATADGTDATKAAFAKDPDSQEDPAGTTFNAIYPSTLYVTNHFELPATQTYSAGGFNAPMYAESTTQTLSFKNICAVLAIKVTKADITTLKSIKVKSDKAMYGTFTVNDDKAVLTDATDAGKAVTLESASALTLDDTGTTFYIAIPEQTYSYLKIYLSEDGTLYKRAMITKKAVGLGTIECNKIYNIDYKTNAVQLYANGPYWSTMNIGATTVAGSGETCYGDYYAWGETEPYYATRTWDSSSGKWIFDTWKTNKTSGYAWLSYCGQSTFTEWSTTPYDATSKNLTETYDAAYQNWGKAWKMPTGGDSGQFKVLVDNTTMTWTADFNGVAGYKFSGKGDYSGIELFFPAAGFGYGTNLSDAGSYGRYWSSSLSTVNTNNAYGLYFSSGRVSPQNSNSRYYGLPVRPVSD